MYHTINPEPNIQKAEIEKPFPWGPFFFIIVCCFVFSHVKIAVNHTTSLPQKYWLILLGKTPKRGDYICFRPSSKMLLEENLPPVITLTKQVVGMPGDNITLRLRDFYINGEYIATAKTHSLTGEPLNVGPTGILPEKHYFVFSPHPSSFDSRYEKMGWVERSQIIGVAYALW